MSGFLDIFMGMFLKWWWIVLPLIFSPYIYYFFTQNKLKNNSNQVVKKEDEDDEYLNVITDEKKYLGIDLDKTTIQTYYQRLKKLVELLQTSKGRVSVNAVEAILLVEYFSNSVLLNENSELVVDLKTINMFCEKIDDDPMKFITYVKAVENKIDLEKKENKIELGTVLYMMRNAKKFGLYIDTDDSELTFKIKSSIHKSDYEDVIINVVDDLKYYEQEVVDNESDFILVNTYEHKEIEPEVNTNSNIISVERLDNDRVVVTTKDGSRTTKDDRVIYSIEKPTEQDIENQIIDIKLNKPVNEEEKKLMAYKKRFGKLDDYEEKTKRFKDRSKRHFEQQLTNELSFEINKLHDECSIEEDFFLCFLSSLFKEKYAMDNGLNFIFIGEVELKSSKIRYCSIDIHYFVNLMYLSMRREYRENFYKFIFGEDHSLNLKNANSFFSKINDKFNIFFTDNNSLMFDAIYRQDSKTIKASILRVDIKSFEDIMKSDSDFAKEISDNYLALKKMIDGVFQVKHFGAAAKNFGADVTLNHNIFFRIPHEEKI